MSDDGNEFGAFLAGFVVGGMIGAAVALLMAPQSGEATRRQIRERAYELRDRAEDIADDTRRRIETTGADVRRQAEEQRARLEQAVAEGKKAAERKRAEMMGSAPDSGDSASAST